MLLLWLYMRIINHSPYQTKQNSLTQNVPAVFAGVPLMFFCQFEVRGNHCCQNFRRELHCPTFSLAVIPSIFSVCIWQFQSYLIYQRQWLPSVSHCLNVLIFGSIQSLPGGVMPGGYIELFTAFRDQAIIVYFSGTPRSPEGCTIAVHNNASDIMFTCKEEYWALKTITQIRVT